MSTSAHSGHYDVLRALRLFPIGLLCSDEEYFYIVTAHLHGRMLGRSRARVNPWSFPLFPQSLIRQLKRVMIFRCCAHGQGGIKGR